MHDGEVAWYSEAVQYQCLPTASAAATAQLLDRHAFAKLLQKDTDIKGKEKASCPRLGQKRKLLMLLIWRM